MEKIILYKQEGNEQEVVKNSAQHKELIKEGWKEELKSSKKTSKKKF